MPTGDPGSEEDTREFPVYPGPYPLPTPAGQPSRIPGSELTPPPTTWPGRGALAGLDAQPAAISSTASRRRSAEYQTSALAAMAGIVLLLFGGAATLVGGAGVATPDLMDEVVRVVRETEIALNRRELRTVLTTAAWVVLVIGIVHLLSALGVFVHRQSGRLVGLALALPGTLLGAYGVAQSLALSQAGVGVGAAPVAAAVVAVGYGLVLFGLVAGGHHFRRAGADAGYQSNGRPAR